MGKTGGTSDLSIPGLNRQIGAVGRTTNQGTERVAQGFHPPGADIHLVMNTFNRMAGAPSIDGSAQCEQIFHLSDYLRLSLFHTVPAEVAIDQELALLESYLRLTSVFRGWTLDHIVSVSASASNTRLRAHSLCLIVQAVLCAYSVDSPGQWSMTVGLARPASGVLGIDVHLQPTSDQAPARRRQVDVALEALCRSMSRPGSGWRHAIRRGRQAGIAVCISID